MPGSAAPADSGHLGGMLHGGAAPGEQTSDGLALEVCKLAAAGNYQRQLSFYVNGVQKTVQQPEPEQTLLRSKLGCGEGGCGACTVMVSHFDSKLGKPVHRAVNACLAPLCSVDGMAVTTVEGIGSTLRGLHPVQERMANAHGSQCGFCTPGIVMAMYTLLRNNPRPTRAQIEGALDGNLCRCTGYRPILDAFKSFAVDGPGEPQQGEERGEGPACGRPGGCCGGGGPGPQTLGKGEEAWAASRPGVAPPGVKICPSTGRPCDCGAPAAAAAAAAAAAPEEVPNAEPIFPPALVRAAPRALLLRGRRAAWLRPLSLRDLLAIKKAHPTARIVCGNTEVGVEQKFKGTVYPLHVAATHVPELCEIEEEEGGAAVRFGASVTLSQLEHFLQGFVARRPAGEGWTALAVLEQLRWFASTQIRNVASVAGNVVTASPISDLNPVYVAAGATFRVASLDGGEREVPAGEFFTGYRTTALRPDELLLSVRLPASRPGEFFAAYKQARRRDDDIAIVTAAFRVRLSPPDPRGGAGGPWVVAELCASYGGMAPRTVAAPRLAAALRGRPWDERALEAGLAAIPLDLPLPEGAPGGMVEYRRSLATSFFFKFFWTAAARLGEGAPGATVAPAPPAELRSALEPLTRPPTSGLQHYDASSGESAVGKPTKHAAAELHVTGEAQYADDIPNPPGGLYGALVLSTRAHARILRVDAAEALAMPGVAAYFGAADVPGSNRMGPVEEDEEVFASEEVHCHGQVVGVVAAGTAEEAAAAARAVRVEYEDLPALLSIEEAIAAGSWLTPEKRIERGDVAAALAAAHRVIEGEVRIGGQEHFYLETQATLAVPGESREMTLVSSTQNPSKTQFMVAKVLGVPDNRVVCKVKRMGGGFGGKETRSIFVAAAAAVAAARLRRPVRIALDRDVDMATSGTRHPFLGRYRLGVAADGRVLAFDVALFSNGGCSADLSSSVLERAMFHVENSYNIPNLRVVGRGCRTNLPSNTAFRGFGGPQGMFVCEAAMDRAAHALGLDPAAFREANLYREGDRTHYGMALEGCHAPRIWADLKASSDYEARRAAAAAFNAANRYRKRGVYMLPVKFGMSFTFRTLNQAGALVHVYLDGTVLVTHAGTEMGQGLHTKVCQVAADALGVPLASVYIAETSTDKVPNTSPTAASVGSDMNGMAVLDACRQIKERLAPIAAARPGASWQEIVHAAWLERVDLSAHGFYRTPDIGYDWATNTGNPFYYFCYGAAVAEVELDALTGEHAVLRADVLHDVGASLNPAIDVGQVEGAFVQGYGLFALEQTLWLPTGAAFTRGPSTYKIPAFRDVPADFRVALLKGAPHPRVVGCSKGVGEPPLFLAASVFFALKEAVRAARAEAGFEDGDGGRFEFDAPATCEALALACSRPAPRRSACF
eukprot:tig00020554_g10889.t1